MSLLAVEKEREVAGLIDTLVLSQHEVYDNQRIRRLQVPLAAVRLWESRFGLECVPDEQIIDTLPECILAVTERSLRVAQVWRDPRNGRPKVDADGFPHLATATWPPHRRILVSTMFLSEPRPTWYAEFSYPRPVKWQTWFILPYNNKGGFVETCFSVSGVVADRYREPATTEDYQGAFAMLSGIQPT